MSKPATYNIELCQGSDFKLTLTIKDQAGTALDLTGWLFESQIRKTISDASVQASFSFNILDQVTNTGQVEMTLDNAVSTALILPKQNTNIRQTVDYAYDVERTDAGGDKQRILQGLVKISPEVTK